MVIDYDDAGRGASVSHEATTSSSWAMTPEKTRGDRDVADITMTYSACGMPDTDFSSDSLAALVLLLRNAFPQSSSADVILQDTLADKKTCQDHVQYYIASISYN